MMEIKPTKVSDFYQECEKCKRELCIDRYTGSKVCPVKDGAIGNPTYCHGSDCDPAKRMSVEDYFKKIKELEKQTKVQNSKGSSKDTGSPKSGKWEYSATVSCTCPDCYTHDQVMNKPVEIRNPPKMVDLEAVLAGKRRLGFIDKLKAAWCRLTNVPTVSVMLNNTTEGWEFTDQGLSIYVRNTLDNREWQSAIYYELTCALLCQYYNVEEPNDDIKSYAAFIQDLIKTKLGLKI